MFDWVEYLNLASELVNRDDEACQRSAVSRAYYAVFCTARDKFQNRGEFHPGRTADDHKDLWDALRNDYDMQRRQIGLEGNRLRGKRNKADYDNSVNNISVFAKTAVESAQETFNDLQDL